MTRLLFALLFGVHAVDWPTHAAMAAILSMVTCLASFLPARRAANVDPAEALRAE